MREEEKKKRKNEMERENMQGVFSVCPSRSPLQPALNPERLTYMNCLGGLLILWLDLAKWTPLVDQRLRNGYLLPEIPPCGSLQPSVPLNQTGPRPLPHSSSDWRKQSPPLPSRSWVVIGLVFTRPRVLLSPCCFYILLRPL